MVKARILVVEDEAVVALQIADALKGMDYEVPLVAMTGEEALARLLETEPDLILMDIHLKGGMSGVEAAALIRKRLDVPVVYLTAFSDDETLEQAQLTEPYGYVLKPFEERSLHAIIQMSLLKHRRTRDSRENGWWMSAVAASMMEAVVICDPKGSVKFANPAADALLGRPREDVVGRHLSDLVRLVDAQTRAATPFPVSEPILEGKSTLRTNCRLVLADDREIPVELSASPLRSPEGTLFGILYVFRETSERERLQQSLLRELDELARVQKKVLPTRETVIPGIRTEWLFLPTAFGGGDTLGCMRLDDDTVGFYALDVVGQGIFSALFSLLLHTFLSPHAERGGMLVQTTCDEKKRRVLSPVEVVREFNRRFFLRDEANPYFTMSYGVMEPASGRVRIARAGHPFPLLVRADGAVQWVKSEGYAVGLFPTTDVSMEELQMRRGDRLFLYSDGLVDATNAAGTRFSSTRLADLATAGVKTSIADLVATLRQALVSWRGSESFADDVSLLIVEKE